MNNPGRKALSGRKDADETALISAYVVAKVKSDSTKRVVDIGCGDGHMLSLVLAAARVGITPGAADAAALSQSHPEIEFRAGTAQAVPVEDAWADIVIMHGVMPVLHGEGILEKCLSEVSRILRPGGILWLGDVKTGVNDEFKFAGSVALGLLRALIQTRSSRFIRHCRRELEAALKADNIFHPERVTETALGSGLTLVLEEPSKRFVAGKSLIAPIRRSFVFAKTQLAAV